MDLESVQSVFWFLVLCCVLAGNCIRDRWINSSELQATAILNTGLPCINFGHMVRIMAGKFLLFILIPYIITALFMPCVRYRRYSDKLVRTRTLYGIL